MHTYLSGSLCGYLYFFSFWTLESLYLSILNGIQSQVDQWYSSVPAGQHSGFLLNIDQCLCLRFPFSPHVLFIWCIWLIELGFELVVEISMDTTLCVVTRFWPTMCVCLWRIIKNIQIQCKNLSKDQLLIDRTTEFVLRSDIELVAKNIQDHYVNST